MISEAIEMIPDEIDNELNELINEPFIDFICERLLDSVSPIVKIVDGKRTIYVNRDEYGHRTIARFILMNTNEMASIIIDGKDIMEW